MKFVNDLWDFVVDLFNKISTMMPIFFMPSFQDSGIFF